MHSCHDKNKTIGYNLCCDIIKVCHDTIQEQAYKISRDRKQKATTEALTKTESSVATDLSIS